MEEEPKEVTLAHVTAQSAKRPLCVPADSKKWKTGNYFGFTTKILREEFMYNSVPFYMKNESRRVFDTHEVDGLWWCVWRLKSSSGPTEEMARGLGYSVLKVVP